MYAHILPSHRMFRIIHPLAWPFIAEEMYVHTGDAARPEPNEKKTKRYALTKNRLRRHSGVFCVINVEHCFHSRISILMFSIFGTARRTPSSSSYSSAARLLRRNLVTVVLLSPYVSRNSVRKACDMNTEFRRDSRTR